MAIFNALDEAR